MPNFPTGLGIAETMGLYDMSVLKQTCDFMNDMYLAKNYILQIYFSQGKVCTNVKSQALFGRFLWSVT